MVAMIYKWKLLDQNIWSTAYTYICAYSRTFWRNNLIVLAKQVWNILHCVICEVDWYSNCDERSVRMFHHPELVSSMFYWIRCVWNCPAMRRKGAVWVSLLLLGSEPGFYPGGHLSWTRFVIYRTQNYPSRSSGVTIENMWSLTTLFT
jgi:hypothetical protein